VVFETNGFYDPIDEVEECLSRLKSMHFCSGDDNVDQ